MLALIGGIYALSSSLLLSSYTELERRESDKNVDRIRDAIRGQAHDLHQGSYDWAHWDDCFQFIQNGNREFIEANLESVTLKLDLMLFIDPRGRIKYSRPVNRTKGVAPPNPNSVIKLLGFDKAANLKNPRRQVGGVAVVDGRVALVTARPIEPSTLKVQPKGWIVWVLYYDAKEIENLSQRSHLGFQVYALSDKKMPQAVREVAKSLKGSTSPVTRPLGDDRVAGYGLVEDFTGRPIAIVRVVEPREIYQQGLQGVGRLLALIAVASLVFSLVFIAILDSFALSRITRLRESVQQVGEEGADLVLLPGNDELSWLSRTIHGLLSSLEDKQSELIENNDELERTVRELAVSYEVLENAVEGISQLRLDGTVSVANQSFARVLGRSLTDINGMHWSDLISPDRHTSFENCLRNAALHGKNDLELAVQRADGSTFPAEVVVVASLSSDGCLKGYHLFIKDLSDRKRLEAAIEHQAFHDSLTGLPNRAMFMDRLSHALMRAKRYETGVAVLFIDLDNFKIINDSLGHEAGDHLLIEIAGLLKSCLRGNDTLSRLSGDEFTILLQDLTDVYQAMEVADRIVEMLAQPIRLEHGETVAMGSIGIAFSPRGEGFGEALLREADTAMYAAKARGKSGYAVFDPIMNQEVVERMELEVGMRLAMERNDFRLVFQPIVDLTSGNYMGVEALLRWTHPEKGIIPPDKFIAIAEETGLIVQLGAWVLREACEQFNELRRQVELPAKFVLSVNVSGRQLQRPEIVDQIRTILIETGMPPHMLMLEITESVLIKDQAESIKKLHKIKALGVGIAIDDFGTGYSSLSMLNSYPVDVVKIDRSFISRMGEESDVDAIVGAIVLLSRAMRLMVTAEGIETRAQLRYVLAFGCGSAQGYYFSRPLPMAKLIPMFGDGVKVSLALEYDPSAIINPILAA